ncbi:hypothetical protein QAD02_000386 [Eretmocerus hayati]|uniref:Uncharacterized protein n=1 Tax=Eretmocerus hayati TaxID=131215 RepID=A0ACC2NDG3_9HYME|nr:hypothetical protein QAD02_000386 [Eretmocerus hayati]
MFLAAEAPSADLASSTLTIATNDSGLREPHVEETAADPGVELLDMSLGPECDMRQLSLDDSHRHVDQHSKTMDESQYQSMYEPMDERVYPEEQSSFRIVWSEEAFPRGDHGMEKYCTVFSALTVYVDGPFDDSTIDS